MSRGTGADAKKHRSNIKWARAYLPEGLPPGITLCSFNRPPHRGNWVARYEGDHNPPLKYDEEYAQQTFSRSFDRVNWVGEILSEHTACARVLRWPWEKHSATEKLVGLPVSETWPKHVVDMLRPCKHCENEMPCKFFRGVVEQGGEEDESGLDDSSCTSGIGSDDSGHSGTAGGKTKPEKKPQKKEQEKKPKEAKAPTAKKKTPKASAKKKPRAAVWGLAGVANATAKAKLKESSLPRVVKAKAKPEAGAKHLEVSAEQETMRGGTGKQRGRPQRQRWPGPPRERWSWRARWWPKQRQRSSRRCYGSHRFWGWCRAR